MPVVLVLLKQDLNAGIVADDLEGSGTDTGIRITPATVRLDDKVVDAEDQRQVAVLFGQRHDDILARSLHRLYAADIAERARFGGFVAVAAKRLHDVLDFQRIAVMKAYVLPDLERPGRSAIGRLP